MTPNIDRNQAPETWITAAPQDTITIHDPIVGPIPPQPGTIPFRYHLYWAGSDQDGEVAGFYFAVVETVATLGLPLPNLPGPKARDYHYTTRRDSTFIFSVEEATNNRQHAFFIYAVDNNGKADPTPARVIFNALDRFPPVPVIDEASARGLVFDPSNLDAPPAIRSFTIRDTFDFRVPVPKDTVASGSELTFKWHADLLVADNPAVAYKYRLDESDFVTVPATVTEKRYNTGPTDHVAVGPKIFTLRAIDRAGGARTTPETTRRFLMNLSPDTWFAGPDSMPASDPSFYTVADPAVLGTMVPGARKGTRYHDVLNMRRGSMEPFPGSLLGPDSVQIYPARRKPNRTFFEIYGVTVAGVNKSRVFVRTEGDTVNMNSWILFFSGGFDPDSPYKVRVIGINPDLPDSSIAPVLARRPPNGSPVAFRFRIPVFLDSVGPVSSYPQSQSYPLSDPASVPEPHIAGYQGMQQSGRAYALVRAEDGDGGLDNRIGDPLAFADSVDRGLISPSSPRYGLRSRVLKFYINRAPYMFTTTPGFQPIDGFSYPTRTIPLRLDMATDDDPYSSVQRSVGGAQAGVSVVTLRYNVQLKGRTASNRDTVYNPPQFKRRADTAINTAIDVPSYIVGPEVTVQIELCDCRDCETVPGQGRCRNYTFNVLVPQLPAPASAVGAGSPNEGPGSSEAARWSKSP